MLPGPESKYWLPSLTIRIDLCLALYRQAGKGYDGKKEAHIMYEEITAQTRTAIQELLEQAKLKPGSLLVIGCSSSEMVGSRIGKGSS